MCFSVPRPISSKWHLSPFFLPTPTLSGTLPASDCVTSCLTPQRLLSTGCEKQSRYDLENPSPSSPSHPVGWPSHPHQPREVRASPATGSPPPAAPSSSGLRPTAWATGGPKPLPGPAVPTALSLPGLPSCHPAPGPPRPQLPGRLQRGTGRGPRVTVGLQRIDEPLPQRLHISSSHCK